MKKIFGIAVLVLGLTLANGAQAQDTTNVVKKAWKGTKKGANKAWKGTKKGAKAVGNETAEIATKSKAKVTDKTSDEWVGPEGQTIYVDDANKYYWVSEKGKRMFVSKDQLKAKGQ